VPVQLLLTIRTAPARQQLRRPAQLIG
jgi:hypothetical protein